MTGYRGVWALIFPPPRRVGDDWILGSQGGVGGGQPRSPFRVSLLVAESSDNWRGLREKNEAEMGLNHFAPSWITNPPTKEAPTLHFSRESRRGAEAGEKRAAGQAGEAETEWDP